jgi:hypothetical protein
MSYDGEHMYVILEHSLVAFCATRPNVMTMFMYANIICSA